MFNDRSGQDLARSFRLKASAATSALSFILAHILILDETCHGIPLSLKFLQEEGRIGMLHNIGFNFLECCFFACVPSWTLLPFVSRQLVVWLVKVLGESSVVDNKI